MRKYIFPIVMLMLCIMTSCNKDEKTVPPPSGFTQSQEAGLMQDGAWVISYDAASWQSSVRNMKLTGTTQYRVYADDAVQGFKLIAHDAIENEGQKVSCDLFWSVDGVSTKRKTGLSFTVQSIADGRIWLWCGKEKIGAIVISN